MSLPTAPDGPASDTAASATGTSATGTSATGTSATGHSATKPERRRYDSPLRRQRATETRDRIVVAGSALLHRFPTGDWRGLTFRAVAECAGVSERTVYRYFSTERELHEAVRLRVVEQAGVIYQDLDLDKLVDVAVREFASFAVAPGVTGDAETPTSVADRRRREALSGAVGPSTASWSDDQRHMAAAILDVLGSGPTYERLTTGWKLGPDQATAALTWAVELLVDAVKRGRRPARPSPGRTAPASARSGRGFARPMPARSRPTSGPAAHPRGLFVSSR